ncbi:MAG: hypothetical protein ACOH5I_17920 [Oligoflexus sp.]
MMKKALRNLNVKIFLPALMASIILQSCTGPEENSYSLANFDERSNLQVFKYRGSIEDKIQELAEQGMQVTSFSLNDDSNRPTPLDMIDPGKTGKIGWPDMPRKVITKSINTSNEGSIHLGVKYSFFDLVDAASEYTITLGSEVTKSLMMLKHAPTLNERMQYLDEHGIWRPYVDDGHAYVGLCVYSTKAKTGHRWLNSLKVSGNGFSTQNEFSQAAEVSQFSEFFHITKSDTVNSLKDICLKLFYTKVNTVVQQDLKEFLLAEAQFTEHSETLLGMAIRQALYGPRVDRVHLFHHHWNIHPVKITSDGNGYVKVEGFLNRNVQAQLDDNIWYTCESQNGVETIFDATHQQRSAIYNNWKADSMELIRHICDDAYIEFRSEVRM